MVLSKFSDILLFSNDEIFEEISKAETELFNIRFKKATRQNFKSHEIKNNKRRLAQLKTLLTVRLQNMEQKT